MPKFSLIVAVGIITYLVPCYMLHLKEAKVFLGRVRDIMARSIQSHLTNLTQATPFAREKPVLRIVAIATLWCLERVC
jgi:hypothetical protein